MEAMCGRFAVTTNPALLAEKIQAIDEATSAANDAAAPNYNVAPTATIATVVRRHTEPDDEPTRRVRLMRWGFIPPWAKTTPDGLPESKGPLMINARADKLTTSPVYRTSVNTKRCLIPMTGWYEWRANPDVAGKKARKTPFFMTPGDDQLICMAGLWSVWRPRAGDDHANAEHPLLSCTIITTDAIGPLAQIHDRMPLMLDEGDWDRWLDPDQPLNPDQLTVHADLARLQVREVSTLVNSVRNNGPELLAPAEPQDRQQTLL
jgi:putative SOS response-associated peptidase YedK